MRRNIISVMLAAAIFLSGGTIFAGTEASVLKTAKGYRKIPVKVVEKIGLPRWYHEGLFVEGKNIWVCNGKNGKIWVVDTVSGKVVSEIEPLTSFIEGMTRSPDGKFFMTDWYEKKIYHVDITGNKITVEDAISVEPSFPAGIIWNDSSLFVITWTKGLLGTKYHLLKIDEKGVLLDKILIRRIQEPAHLAWDGKYLWITSWYNKMVYKVDIEKRAILGAFRSPVSKTTGIAWDGEYLWLTGTYGDLYKIEVGK